MKVLVTGTNGQLGSSLMAELHKRKISCVGIDRTNVDLTDGPRTALLIEEHNPDVVIHCAAYTAVDKAQEDGINCHAMNATTSRMIARTCKKIDAKMVFISTDYVFSGKGDEPFEINSPKGPLNEYGLSKLAGEEAVKSECSKFFIVRTSWVFANRGINFVKKIEERLLNNDDISVVDDQIGSPTFADDLAVLICDMIKTDKYGVYHATNEGYCSFYDFACEISKYVSSKSKITPVKTKDFPAKATRPLNSRLSKKSLDDNGFNRLPTWQDALKRYFN